MTHVNVKTYSQRGTIVLILVICFVLVMLTISSIILITHPYVPKAEKLQKRTNILLIIIDDLRPALRCYGDEKAITPNIDQLATKSVLFKNAYAQISSSAPSRASLLMGRRPDSLQIYESIDTHKNFTSLPQHFKNHGYETLSIGRIFDFDNIDDLDNLSHWTYRPYYPPSSEIDDICSTTDGDFKNLICPVSSSMTALPDIEIREYAVNYLQNKSMDNGTIPFFLAVGFHRPHIPFKFPMDYLDLHPLDDIDVVSNNSKPTKMPNVAWNPWMDFRSKHDVKKLNMNNIDTNPFDQMPIDFQKRIIQAYYASVSYIDDQVGKLLEGLELSGYASNTVTVLLSDNGFSLGEHGEWSKYSNFDVSVKVPLLTYVPELTNHIHKHKLHKPFHYIPVTSIKREEYVSAHVKYVADEMVELVDLFPTLTELLNIAIPPMCKIHVTDETFCADGISFFPVIVDHVFQSMDFSWKTAVFSQYPRPSNFPQNDSDYPSIKNIKIMGYTVKDPYFRYTRWVHFNNWFMKPEWGTFEGHELYNVRSDPLEINNLVDEPHNANIVISMFKKLRKGWRKSLPFGVHSAPINEKSLHRRKTFQFWANKHNFF